MYTNIKVCACMLACACVCVHTHVHACVHVCVCVSVCKWNGFCLEAFMFLGVASQQLRQDLLLPDVTYQAEKTMILI